MRESTAEIRFGLCIEFFGEVREWVAGHMWCRNMQRIALALRVRQRAECFWCRLQGDGKRKRAGILAD